MSISIALPQFESIPKTDSLKRVSCHTIEVPNFVTSVSFAPFQWSHNLLAYECDGRVMIVKTQFISDVASRDDKQFDYVNIHQFVIGVKCSAIAFGPQTNVELIPKCLQLAVASYDNCVRLLSSQDIESPQQTQFVTLNGHRSFVNDVVFEPKTGHIIASVGDDCLCCLWSVENGQLIDKLSLTSAGVSIKWHINDTDKLLIGEKKGVIRIYNIDNKSAMMSFDCNKFPLLCIDWCPANILLIGCVADDVFLWDTSVSSQPIDRRKGHPQCGQKFAFYDDTVIATRGRPNGTIHVENLKNNQVLLNDTIKVGDGLSWNCKEPILAAGGNRAVHIYKFNIL